MNVNTNASASKPFYAQSAYLHTFSSKCPKYLAIKASQDLSILQILDDEQLSVLHSLSFEDLKPADGFFPLQFDFISGDNPEKSSLLVAYENGCLINIDFLKKDVISVVNSQPNALTHKPVYQILLDPLNPKEVLTIFEDSTALKYNIDYPESEFYLGKFAKFEEKTSFNPKLNKFIYKHKDNDFLEQKRNWDPAFPELNFFACINKQKLKDSQPQNPLAYYKFNCNFMSNACFYLSPFFEKINAKPSKGKTPEVGVFAYVGFDGYLRVFDYFWFTPLFSFKSRSGGFSSICFSPNGDLIGLTGHDDTITVLDLNSFKSLSITGHRSFTTKVIIQEPENNIVRVLAASLDSFFTLSEFDKRIFMLEEDNNTRRIECNDKFPRRVVFNELERLSLKPNFFLKVSNDGIGSFELFSRFLFINSYDGTVGVWNFECPEEHRKNKIKATATIESLNNKGPSIIKETPVEKVGGGETVEDCQDSSGEKDLTGFFERKAMEEASTNTISTANVAS